MTPEPKLQSPRSQMKVLLFGSVIPLAGYAIIENEYGPFWGTVAGMVLGVGEIAYEYYREKKVSKLTWGSNAMILVLGVVTIFTNEGFWFKLQPTIFELLFAFMLWGSLFMKKNLFIAMAEKQGSKIPEEVKPRMSGVCFRVGVLMFIHALLNVWAAFYWSTSAWIFLKGLGLTLSMLVYMVIEGLFLRRSLKKKSALDRALNSDSGHQQ